jgi:hypothetical protein
MEVELPAVVAEDPERRAVGDGNCGRGPVGGKGDGLGELVDVKVVDGGGTRLTLEENVDGLLPVEDAAGGAELLIVFGEERGEVGSIGFAVRVEKAFFERVEMVLEFGVLHATLQLLYE